jgi:hypothetical protein
LAENNRQNKKISKFYPLSLSLGAWSRAPPAELDPRLTLRARRQDQVRLVVESGVANLVLGVGRQADPDDVPE